MASIISICSNALLRLGQQPIASFDDGTDMALLCSNLWPIVYDRTIRSHPWNCAVKRVVLSPESSSPEWKYKNKFVLPGDWIRTLSVGNNDGSDAEYMQEGVRILSDESALYLRYVFRQDVSNLDDSIIEVLVCAMAAEMAYPVTQSASLADMMASKHERAMQSARSIDAQENPQQSIQPSSLYSARFGRI